MDPVRIPAGTSLRSRRRTKRHLEKGASVPRQRVTPVNLDENFPHGIVDLDFIKEFEATCGEQPYE